MRHFCLDTTQNVLLCFPGFRVSKVMPTFWVTFQDPCFMYVHRKYPHFKNESASDLIYLGTQALADFLDNDTCKGTADQND